MRKLIEELGLKQDKFVVYSDSQSAIHLFKNSTFHSRSKHIEVRYHWIRDVLQSKQLYLEKIHTNENGSDMLTKCLSKEKLEACRQRVDLVEPMTLGEGGERFVGSAPFVSWTNGLSPWFEIKIKNQIKKGEKGSRDAIAKKREKQGKGVLGRIKKGVKVLIIL